MLFRILGDVSVVGDDGETLNIAAPKQRALLARLILDTNRVVGRSALMEALWGDELPDHPETALQVVVSRLRASLGQYGTSVVSETGGYRLDSGRDEVDLSRAESLLRDGRLALASNEAGRAAACFERALALWTGDALRDVADFVFSGDASRRLHELRVMLVEARNDAYLASGRHLEVLAGIDAWVAAEPLREHLRAQQIAALYRAGRQAEALRACDSLRKALRDELGLDPSQEIQGLERRVLDQDPGLVATDAGFMTPLPAWTAETLAFVGRDAQYEQVLARLAESVKGGLRFVLFEGEPGIGKSRLLLQIARRVANDAIVLPIHAHNVFSPALHAFARVIAEATLGLSDDELTTMIESVPDFPSDLARVRSMASQLVSHQPMPGSFSDEGVLRFVAPWIAALSAKAPVVVIIDDLDQAGTSMLHVIGQLAALSMPKRVLIVGSARTYLEQTPLLLGRLIAAFEGVGWVDRVALAPLQRRDIDQLLGRMRVAPRNGIVDRLFELTAGNPLLLAELLNSGAPEEIVEQWSSPPRIRDIARKRTAELGRATAELLQIASLFDYDFTIPLLAEVAGTSEASTIRLVDRAVEARVLQQSTLHTYRFTHQPFRRALLADVAAPQLADGHRRIACSLETLDPPPAPALLAGHWAGARGDDVPAKVLMYARAAGRESVRMFEPTAAVKWFDLALEQLPDDVGRGALLAELAEAQQFAGDDRGTATLQEVVDIALDTQDDGLVLQIVRVTTPGWSTLPGVEGLPTRRLLARALEIADDDATRSRILARRAVDMQLDEPVEAVRVAEEAVALARAGNDRTALLESLLRRASLSLAPHGLAARRLALQEVLELSSRSTDVVTRYFALSANVIAAMQAVRPAEAELAAAEADSIVAQYGLAPLRWSATVRRAWTAGLAGRLDRAEQLIDEAAAHGDRHGISHAPTAALLQRALLRWHQERVGEGIANARVARDTYAEQFPGIALVSARALAEDPASQDEARAILAGFGASTFAKLPLGTFWSSILVATAETACILELADVAAIVRDLLLPFTDQVAVSGLWVAAPIAYGVGIAARACGDPRASAFLAQAAEIADELQAPVLAGWARGKRLAHLHG